PPFEPLVVAIDSSSLASPLWVPAYGSMSVELGPNRFRRLDIPVAPGGVIEGRVLRQSVDGTEPVPVAGARLFLKNRATHDVRTLATFSDGDFYMIGVKPGDYDLWVDPGALSRMGLSGAPISFTMRATPDGATVDGLEIKLK
ncbi:MAG TPA: carboxypeptidase-like regulatory domain-containing protein, partial [Gemmatimonadales bacterium]|nr:carboxypeptidase-like regulatory domain-containing protein [Gemmatimonadales bacterium]